MTLLPATRADVTLHRVGPAAHDWILVDGRSAHAVNASAAAVWVCLDGTSGLDDVVADVADVFDIDRTVVRDDIAATIDRFVELGLLIDREPRAVPQSAAAPTAGDPTGTYESPFTGSRLTLPGHASLLLHWHPGCGYCVGIADAVGQSMAADPSITVVSTGADEDDRRLATEHDIPLDRIVRAPAGGAFAGLGTPAALTVEPDGTVTAALAYGADQVRSLLEERTGLDLARVRVPDGLQLLDQVGGVCAPGTGTAVEAVRPLETIAVRAGTTVVGVQPSSTAAANALRSALGRDAIVAVEGRLSAHFTITIDDDTDDRTGHRPLARLNRGSRLLVRSKHPERVLHGLAQHLAAIAHDPPAATTPVGATALVRDDEAILMPRAVHMRLAAMQGPLARWGWHVVDVPVPAVDLAAATLVVPNPSEVVPNLPPPVDDARDRTVTAGRYRLTWWLLARNESLQGPLERAAAVAAAVPLVTPAGGAAPVEGLSACFERVRAQACWIVDARDLRRDFPPELR